MEDEIHFQDMKDDAFQEIAAQMAEPSSRKARRGSRQWIDDHEKRDVILALVDLFVEGRGKPGSWSFDEFTTRALQAKFGYPFEAAAFRTYVLTHHVHMRRAG